MGASSEAGSCGFIWGQPDTGNGFNQDPDTPVLPILRFGVAECYSARLDSCGKGKKTQTRCSARFSPEGEGDFAL